MMFCKTGIRKARVFPVPVRACASLLDCEPWNQEERQMTYTSPPFNVSLIVRLCTWVMVSNPMSSVKVLTIVGQTIPRSPSSSNLVTGPCRTASLICLSDGGRCAVTSSAISFATASAYAFCCLMEGELLNGRSSRGVLKMGLTCRPSGRETIDLVHDAERHGKPTDLASEAGPLRTTLNISRNRLVTAACSSRLVGGRFTKAMMWERQCNTQTLRATYSRILQKNID